MAGERTLAWAGHARRHRDMHARSRFPPPADIAHWVLLGMTLGRNATSALLLLLHSTDPGAPSAWRPDALAQC